MQVCSPKSILATDTSENVVVHAREAIADPRVSFRRANAHSLTVEDKNFDFVTSALVMNFIPDRVASLVEIQRVLRPRGLLSFYFWGYPGGGVEFIDAF